MVRNNEDRFGPRGNSSDEVPQSSDAESILQFVAPTEFVELPSKGQGYPEGHPLYGQGEIEREMEGGGIPGREEVGGWAYEAWSMREV